MIQTRIIILVKYIKPLSMCHNAIISQGFKLLPDLKHFDNEIKTIISDSVLNEFMILRAAAAHCRYFKGTIQQVGNY